MSLEHNFYGTNEICYQGKAGQVHQLKKKKICTFPSFLPPFYFFFFLLPAMPVNGPALFKMIDFYYFFIY